MKSPASFFIVNRIAAVFAVAACLLGRQASAQLVTPSQLPFTSLYVFPGDASIGAESDAPLMQAADGNFYGTTADGGSNFWGAVFRITTNGIVTELYGFLGSGDGGEPKAGLIQASNGLLYGTTSAAGNYGGGTIFSISTAGDFSVQYEFTNGIGDGGNPEAPLLQAGDGNLYGMAQVGGSNGFGSVFQFTTNGEFTEIFAFTGTDDGDYPEAGLIQASNGLLYGTTSGAGVFGYGNIFSISTNGEFSIEYSFTNGIDGAYPATPLMQGSDGNLYGAADSSGSGHGTVFQLTTNGVFSSLYSFTDQNDGSDPLGGLVQGGDGFLYGTANRGGYQGQGTVFQMTTGGVLTGLYAFLDGNDGGFPAAGLVKGSDGQLYGTASGGGIDGNGTIFRIGAPVPAFSNLYSFSYNNNGDEPYGSLIQASNGLLFGTTEEGGTNGGFGTIFEMTTNGVLTSIYSFSNGIDGFRPEGALLQASDGNLYGGAIVGGANGQGTLFRITTSGVFTALHAFNDSDGYQPGSLIQASDGNLYGTTDTGGSSGSGTVFKISTNGLFTSLFSFTNGINGSYPNSPLVQAGDGNLYGTTSGGGSRNYGIVFRVSTDGTITNLHSFTNGIDGGYPDAGLALASDGMLYGTETLGADENGTIFSITTNGVFTSLYSFTGGDDGSNPQAQLIQGSDGILYGTAAHGGTNGAGTIFGITTSGQFTSLYSFMNGDDGESPNFGLVQATNGILYGTCPDGGTNGAGTVFDITTNGDYTNLVSFNFGADGQEIEAPLLEASNGVFYGATYDGGTNQENGTIFQITSNGVFTSLYSFTGGNDGSGPNAPLVQAGDGLFYGTAGSGGTNGDGTVFEMTTSGVVTPLYSFTGGADGAYPDAALALANDGNLYGTAYGGGSGNNGTVFRITTGGALTPLYSFTGGVDGAHPEAALALANDGNLYGTAYGGGSGNNGTVFRITTSGQFNSFYSFSNGLDGGEPEGALVQGADGCLYGTASQGGAYGDGTVFRISTSGVFTTVYAFTGGYDGANPYYGLVQGRDGNFYGTIPYSGAYYGGTMFQLTPGGLLTVLHSFTGGLDGSEPFGGLVLTSSGSLYGTTPYGSVAGNGNIFSLSGPYIADSTNNPVGTLEVTLGPAAADTNGAMWQVNGGPWMESGATTNLAAGSYQVCFTNVDNWTAPACQTVQVNGEETSMLTFDYATNFTVSVSAYPGTDGTVGGGGIFASNSTVTVMATNNADYFFSYWSSNGVNVSTSSNYTFTLGADVALVAQFLPLGNLWGMGWNQYDQLGNVNTNDKITFPEQLMATNVVAIATEDYDSLYLLSDGSLWGMGNNVYGELGQTNNAPYDVPVLISSNVTSIAGGYEFSMFIKSDGSLWTMGNNNGGELGIGSTGTETNRPIEVESSGVVAAAGGFDHSLFLKSDGSLWGMGAYDEIEPDTTTTPVLIEAGNVTAIACGWYHSLFIESDGSLWGMGMDYNGELGDGQEVTPMTPVEIESSNVIAVAAGDAFSLFIKSDGSLWAMGLNSQGQLGDGTYGAGTNLPEMIEATNVTAVAAGSEHSLFTKSDGSLWGMGANSLGELGLGGLVETNRPVMIEPGGVLAISAEDATSLFISPGIPVYYSYTVGVSPSGSGTVTPGGSAEAGSSITVVATNNPGYEFVDWTSNGVTTVATSNYTFTLNTNVTLVANIVPYLFEVFEGSNYVYPSDQLDFGNILQGQSTQISFVVTNPGIITTYLGIALVPTGYTVVPTITNNTPVAPGSTLPFALQLDTSTLGVFSGQLEFTNDTSNDSYAFHVSFTVVAPEPEFELLTGSNGVASNQTISFGANVLNQAASNVSFTITNPGTGTLYVGAPSLPATNYSLTTPVTNNTPVAPGGSLAFTVQLGTAAAGIFAGSVSITNNTTNENPFVFDVTGTVELPPEILVFSGTNTLGNPITNGQTITLSNVLQGQAGPEIPFIVTNAGGQPLTVAASAAPSGYTIISNLTSPIAANGAAALVLRLDTSNIGTYAGDITLTNDSTNSPFVISLSSTVYGPEMDVLLGTAPITGTVSFGNIPQGSTGPIKVFTITNSGNTNLTAGAPSVPNGFLVLTNPPATIAPGSSGSFAVQLFTSGSAMTFSGNVSIANNSTNNPYLIAITGTVTSLGPEIQVSQGTNILTNNQSPTISFGSAALNQAGPILSFTVSNVGAESLSISNLSVPTNFTLVTNLATNLIPAGSDGDFAVQLNTTTAGVASGDITITNGDTNHNPFIIPVSGTVTAPVGPGAPIIALSGSLDFGVVPLGSAATNSITISNLGTTNLIVSGILFPTSVFSPTWSSGSIAPGSNQEVSIVFSPLIATNYSGTVTVVSDAASGTSNLAVIAFGAHPESDRAWLLTLITNPPNFGEIKPNDAKPIKDGTKVTLKATATDPTAIFVNWTGSYNANANPLVFKMTNDTIVQANFTNNPFLTLAGSYNGLFWAGQTVNGNSAGWLKSLLLTTNGAYSGSMVVEGKSASISGAFDPVALLSSASAKLSATEGTVAVSMELISNETAPQITGSVSNGAQGWLATNLVAYRAAASGVSAASYTLILQPDTNVSGSPTGYGYALIAVAPAKAKTPAIATITGQPADGSSTFTQTVGVTPDGQVPVYASVDSGKGFLLGWINLTNSGGPLYWIHPKVTTRNAPFPSGFVATNPIAVANWSSSADGYAQLFGNANYDLYQYDGMETNALTNFSVNISSTTGKFSSDEGSVTVTLKTGKLSVTIGKGSKKVTGTGAILLDGTNTAGYGFFFTPTTNGAILLQQ